jgi:flagellar biosynthesis protein FlhB
MDPMAFLFVLLLFIFIILAVLDYFHSIWLDEYNDAYKHETEEVKNEEGST